MRQIELLAPARDLQIGIAAIDCGADAVYIAGPQFGARQAAGNEIEDIRQLCNHAHKFGARIFITLNTILYDSELEDAYRFMLEVQDAGADAIIVQDLAIAAMVQNGIGNIKEDIRIPLHASTQCAIRTPEQARFLESLGFSRIILERQLSLEQIKAIKDAVTCELEFFVHGAICVCYSGQCYLSELISQRSANRGACIQACRSRYDLVDASGKVLVRDKALLSLKDYNLRDRVEELADAGITSFKIEGRLKNASYVKNIVRDYSLALDDILSRRSTEYERGSFGKVTGGFTPDAFKTFNRGYTELFLDGKRGKWAAMDAAKSMGEPVGTVSNIGRGEITVRMNKGVNLNNGDGFSFVSKTGNVEGFRGDVCSGSIIRCKIVPSLFVGAQLYRNINSAFEKEVERQACIREISVNTDLTFTQKEESWILEAVAVTEDGRRAVLTADTGNQKADNQDRMANMLRKQIGKTTGHYRFSAGTITTQTELPFMAAAFINGIRRELAEELDRLPCNKKDILLRNIEIRNRGLLIQKNVLYKSNVSNHLSEETYRECGAEIVEKAYELTHPADAELMRSRYCIRYEIGMCPKHHGCKDSGPLFLLNNGQRFALRFDCRNCEMTVINSPAPQK